MKITQLYFASLKEQLNTGSEQLDLPDTVRCIADLSEWIINRGGNWKTTWQNQTLMVAVNQDMASPTTAINEGDEVAWFPPVTGG